MQGKVVFCKTFGSHRLIVRDSYADIPGIDTSWIQRIRTEGMGGIVVFVESMQEDAAGQLKWDHVDTESQFDRLLALMAADIHEKDQVVQNGQVSKADCR